MLGGLIATHHSQITLALFLPRGNHGRGSTAPFRLFPVPSDEGESQLLGQSYIEGVAAPKPVFTGEEGGVAGQVGVDRYQRRELGNCSSRSTACAANSGRPVRRDIAPATSASNNVGATINSPRMTVPSNQL